MGYASMKALPPPNPDAEKLLRRSSDYATLNRPRKGERLESWQYRYDRTTEPKELLPALHSVIDAMLYGVSQDIVVDGSVVYAGTPIGLPVAAKALGFRVKLVRRWADTKVFQEALREAMRARRVYEDPVNLATAIELRDKIGDGSVERDRTRLKAIESIRAKELPPPVNVNISQRVGIANVVPGYVIKLDEKAPLPETDGDD